jgi:hypothetical protein
VIGRALVASALASVILIASACDSSSTDTSGSPTPAFTVGMQAKMNGRKDGVVVPVINVWNTVPPSEAVCTLQHNTSVTITDSKYNTGDKRWYYKIDSGGSCAGWVPETSIVK